MVAITVFWFSFTKRNKSTSIKVEAILMVCKQCKHIITTYEKAGETDTNAHFKTAAKHTVSYGQPYAQQSCIIAGSYGKLVIERIAEILAVYKIRNVRGIYIPLFVYC